MADILMPSHPSFDDWRWWHAACAAAAPSQQVGPPPPACLSISALHRSLPPSPLQGQGASFDHSVYAAQLVLHAGAWAAHTPLPPPPPCPLPLPVLLPMLPRVHEHLDRPTTATMTMHAWYAPGLHAKDSPRYPRRQALMPAPLSSSQVTPWGFFAGFFRSPRERLPPDRDPFLARVSEGGLQQAAGSKGMQHAAGALAA